MDSLDFILDVLTADPPAEDHPRLDEVRIARRRVSARYNELKSRLPFGESAHQARKEWLRAFLIDPAVKAELYGQAEPAPGDRNEGSG